MRLVSSNVSVIILKDAGHWIMEEKPKETMDALIAFL
jgi:pimeloyl-ACP methyl ester carboxylesterase